MIQELIDRCDFCGGELQSGVTTLEIWRGEELLVIKDVPADVCPQCHEAYVSAEINIRLDSFVAVHHQHRPERYIPVPQYTARQVMA